MAIVENRDPLEPSLPDNGARRVPVDTAIEDGTLDPALRDQVDPIMADAEVLALLGEAKRMARNYQQVAVLSQWESSAAAYRSEHSSRSKYRLEQYRNRARYFKPKTREAVRKA